MYFVSTNKDNANNCVYFTQKTQAFERGRLRREQKQQEELAAAAAAEVAAAAAALEKKRVAAEKAATKVRYRIAHRPSRWTSVGLSFSEHNSKSVWLSWLQAGILSDRTILIYGFVFLLVGM